MRCLLLLTLAACSPAPYTIDATAGSGTSAEHCTMQFTGGGFGGYACTLTLEGRTANVEAIGFPGTPGYPGMATLHVMWNAPTTQRAYRSDDPDVQGGALVSTGEGASLMTWTGTGYALTLTSLDPLHGTFEATLEGPYAISFTGFF
jgi:hypothetical protein